MEFTLTQPASTPEYPLADAPPGYLRSLTWSVALTLAALLAAAATPAVTYATVADARREHPYARLPMVVAADLMERGLLCAAVFLLTRRQPGAPAGLVHPSMPALALRLAAVASFGMALLRPDRVAGPHDLPTLVLTMTALLTYLAAGPYYWYLTSLATRLAGRERLAGQFRALVVVAPVVLIAAASFRAQDPRFAPLPLVVYGFAGDDFAAIHAVLHARLFNGAFVPQLVPALFHVWTAWLLARLWLAVPTRGPG